MPNNGQNTAIGGGGFHHVAIRAYDFDATLRFYTDVLGFVHTHAWGEDGRPNGEADSRAALLDVGDGNYLEVFAGKKGNPGDTETEGAIIHFAVRSNDPAAAVERARAAGAAVTMEPKTVMPPNSARPLPFFIAFIQGPNGELVEFFHNDTL